MMIVQRPKASHLHSPRRRGWRHVTAALVALGVATAAPAAQAEDATSDYCRKVTARADGDAALLMAPTASAQLIRYPQSALLDSLGVSAGRDVQPRATMSIGFVDIYKGLGVVDVARKDCTRQELSATLQEMLLVRDAVAKRYALERRLAYYQEHSPVLEELLAQTEARFVAGTSTLVEVHQVRRRVLEATLRATETEGALDALRQRGELPSASLEDVLAKYEAASVAYEGSVEHVRNLQPWKVGLTTGVTALPTLDYFGALEVSYNLGGLFSTRAEARAVSARAAELRSARYEMRSQVELLQKEIRVQVAILRRQVARLDEEIARVARDRAAVEPSDAPGRHHLIAMLTVEAIDLESERVFLNALAERQSAIGGGK